MIVGVVAVVGGVAVSIAAVGYGVVKIAVASVSALDGSVDDEEENEDEG